MSQEEEASFPTSSSKSSVFDASVNLVKLCVGTGVLALPFAIAKGGLLFGPLAISFIAVWNAISCTQMIDCKYACQERRDIPLHVHSTYSRIAYCGGGIWASMFTDACIIVTLLGVCVTYQITFAMMLNDMSIEHYSQAFLTILSAVLLFPLTLTRDLSGLAIVSKLGLACLLVSIFTIFAWGMNAYGMQAWQGMWTSSSSSSSSSSSTSSLPLFPLSASDFTSFWGIATFGFGLCSLAFNVEESLENKEEFPTAVKYSLVFIWACYSLVGDIAACLYVYDTKMGIASNILLNLPAASAAAKVVRICMAFVCLLTFPLTFIPPAQMLERSLSKFLSHHCRGIRSSGMATNASNGAHAFNYNSINNSDGTVLVLEVRTNTGLVMSHPSSLSLEAAIAMETAAAEESLAKQEEGTTPFYICFFFRLVLIVCTTTVALFVPCFALIIALLGCFTVSILTYVLPSYLSMKIISEPNVSDADAHFRPLEPFQTLLHHRDFLMCVAGGVTSLFTTCIVAREVYMSYTKGECG